MNAGLRAAAAGGAVLIAAWLPAGPVVTAAASPPGNRPPAAFLVPAMASRLVHNNALYGVSCPSWTDCMAVGSRAGGTAVGFRSLAERWDGRRWRVVPMPGPALLARTQVTQVSCGTPRFCVATGYHYRPGGTGFAVLAERWTGARWLIIQSRNPGAVKSAFLNGVSCGLALGCMAVGGYATPSGEGHGLAEWWARGRWHQLRVRQPAGAVATELDGVSCEPRFCLAVGMYSDASGRILTLAERWTGRRWRWMGPPNAHAPTSVLQSVACVTRTSCVAVGDSEWTNERPLADRWTNGRWHRMPGGRLAGGLLTGVSCRGHRSCVAVGSFGRRPLAEAWSGAAWRVLRTVRAAGRPADELSQVSCRTGAARCIAVGARYLPGQFVMEATLAEWWSGRAWRLMTTDNP